MAAERLTDDQWQFRKAPQAAWRFLQDEAGRRRRSPAWSTARASSSTAGVRRRRRAARSTAAALEAGERPLDWKPDVCWQLPLRLRGAHRRPRPRHSRCASGSAATGARAASSSTGGAPRTPDAFVGHKPVYDHDARRDRRAGRRAGVRHARAWLIEREPAERAASPTAVYAAPALRSAALDGLLNFARGRPKAALRRHSLGQRLRRRRSCSASTRLRMRSCRRGHLDELVVGDELDGGLQRVDRAAA